MAATAALAGSAAAAPAEAETILVKIDPAATLAERAEVENALDAQSAEDLGGGWRAYDVEDPTTLAEARAELKGPDADTAVALDAPLFPTGIPNDPLFPPVSGGYQWALENTGAWGGSTAGADIQAPEAWDASGVGAAVIVAVTDTGVDINHPDLAGRIWTNPQEIAGNGVDDDGNGLVDDVTGWDFVGDDGTVFDQGDDESHGTHVAGVIAATQGNGVGIAGVAPNARIMPLKFISGGVGYTSDAIAALNYAASKGATVVNASWGGGGYSRPLCDTISQIASQGVTFVGAAGNNAFNTDAHPTSPAACSEPTTLTVASTGGADGMSSFSNYGPATVDLGAPGENIISTVPGGYGYKSGTSMAAPHVTGVAAVVRGMRPNATPAQVKDAVVRGAVPIPALAGRTVSGARLSLAGAVARVKGIPISAPSPAPSTGSGATPPDADDADGQVRLSIRARAAGGHIVTRVSSNRTGRATVSVYRARRRVGTFRVSLTPGTTTAAVPVGVARRMRKGGAFVIGATLARTTARTRVRVRPFALVNSRRMGSPRSSLRVSLSRASRLTITVLRGDAAVAHFHARGARGVSKVRVPPRVSRRVRGRSGRYTMIVSVASTGTSVKGVRFLSRSY